MSFLYHSRGSVLACLKYVRVTAAACYPSIKCESATLPPPLINYPIFPTSVVACVLFLQFVKQATKRKVQIQYSAER